LLSCIIEYTSTVAKLYYWVYQYCC